MVLVNLLAGQEETQTLRTNWWTTFCEGKKKVGQTEGAAPPYIHCRV